MVNRSPQSGILHRHDLDLLPMLPEQIFNLFGRNSIMTQDQLQLLFDADDVIILSTMVKWGIVTKVWVTGICNEPHVNINNK
jgi:hypothetical protein